MKGHTLTPEDEATLEQLIDKYHLAAVIESLANVCCQKELHLESNWQDTKSAKAWAKAAQRLAHYSSLADFKNL